MNALVLSTALTTLLAQTALGGALFEHRVIDPVWPWNPAIVQPSYGGVRRVRFWLPAHIAFELSLIAALILAWADPAVRLPLLVALLAHATMRLWSAFDLIPKALAFERAAPAAVNSAAAQGWVGRSLARLPLAMTTSFATLVAFGLACAARIGGPAVGG